MRTIESIQNPLVKNIIKLQEKARERKKQKLFVVEGKREVNLALKSGYQIQTLLIVPTIVTNNDLISKMGSAVDVVEISKEIYQKIAYRDSTEGIVALVATKPFLLENIIFTSPTPLLLVLEGIEKPGNIGAMLRTADASNIDAVFIADPKTDIFNPNIIRSSVGCIFTNQIGIGSSKEIIHFLKAHDIAIYSATLQNSNPYFEENYTEASALVVGTEATGLSEIWRSEATQSINIPMQGEIDSMNVSVAAAILIFEAKRQRNFK